MSVKSIPRFLLVHSATYEKWTGTTDRDGVKVFETAVTLDDVRLEPAKKSILSVLGEFKNDKYLLFYDGRNSTPSGVVFNKGDKVTFSGSSMTVRDAEPLYADDNEIHHWEVYLT